MADRRAAVIIGVIVLVALGILGLWGLSPDDTTTTTDNLTEVIDPGTLRETVNLSHLGIETSTNYVGHKIYLVGGTLKNLSDKPLRLIEVKMSFMSYDGKMVEEGVHTAFELKQKSLEPGTEYRFKIAFENLPRTWNYRVPTTEIVKAAY